MNSRTPGLDPETRKQLLALERKKEVNNKLKELNKKVKTLFVLNGQRMRDEDTLLKKIIKLEKALLKKADKPTKKAVKAEVKKQKKGLLALLKKVLNKRKK